ncbi:MAG: DUF11 domain-containing protein [Gammaproteobacteria bacterium]|nr:DUF11 domain-containing protein [Gammaproteobacteria bacterium]MBU1725863.1 DUF11 domain-containing protein [Gammaproteobacteria bacterium]MBU2005163.1 DUF11 domain-containing protein [Gammaproteobacteria bacterium]
MKKVTNVKALLLTFCAVGVLAAANQSWAASEIANCAQVTATNETDVNSAPNNKADTVAILAAVTGGTNENDESCAILTVESIFDFGDAPAGYGTLLADTGAQHEIIPGLKLGGTVDEEADGQNSSGADGDGTDEDGVTGLTTLQDGQSTVELQVTATNTTGTDATVACWIDYNGNQQFEAAEFGSATIIAGSDGSTPVTVTMPAVPADASTTLTDSATYARCRLTTESIDGNKATGLMADGEVEDYKVTFTAQPVFDLALVKRIVADQVTPIKPGHTVKFTVEVINQGTVEAKDVVVTDYIPTGLTLADAAWTDNTDGTATLTAPITSIPAGESATVQISFTVAETATAGDLTNTAEISSAKDAAGNPATDTDSTADANKGNDPVVTDDVTDNTGGDEDDHDIAKITIVVDPKVDIELVKTVTDTSGTAITTVRRGMDLIYVLTATNNGPDAATGVAVKDQLPTSLTYKSDDSAGAYDSATGAWTVGDMANGESKVLKITATVK